MEKNEKHEEYMMDGIEKEKRIENLECTAFVLRGLISYHKKLLSYHKKLLCTFGNCATVDIVNGTVKHCGECGMRGENEQCPSVEVANDLYLRALNESLILVERELAVYRRC